MTKKLMSVVLGLSLLAPVAILAGQSTEGDKGKKQPTKTTKKKTKTKSGKKATSSTTPPPK